MSDDPFARLGLEPRPWQDADRVRRAYQERARTLHPDTDGGDTRQFRELGTAYAQIRTAGPRLRALAAGKPTPAAPLTDTDLFLQIGTILQKRRGLAHPTTPLERALHRVQTQRTLTELASARAAVTERLATCESDLRQLDDRWPDVTADELVALAARSDRLENWNRQLAEAELALV